MSTRPRQILTAVFSILVIGAAVMLTVRHRLPAALFGLAAVLVAWATEQHYPRRPKTHEDDR